MQKRSHVHGIIAISSSVLLHAGLLLVLLFAFPSTQTSFSPVGHPSTVDLTEEIKKIALKKTKPLDVGDVSAKQIKAEAPTEEKPPAPNDSESQTAQAPTTSKESRESEEGRYISELTSLLNKNKKYPRESILREQEGLVVISVSLDHDGIVHESRIEAPSPFRLLNDAALQTIASVGRFPSPPLSLLENLGSHGAGSLRLKVPISFRIERR